MMTMMMIIVIIINYLYHHLLLHLHSANTSETCDTEVVDNFYRERTQIVRYSLINIYPKMIDDDEVDYHRHHRRRRRHHHRHHHHYLFVHKNAA